MHSYPSLPLRAISIILACILFTACTSLQHVSSSDIAKIHAIVKPGDKVSCTLRDGSTAAFEVRSVDREALIGDGGRRVAIANITSMEIKRSDTTKSVLLGLAIAAGVAAAAAAGGGGGGGGGGY